MPPLPRPGRTPGGSGWAAIFILILLLVAVPAASAREELMITDMSVFNITAPEGKMIDSMRVEHLNPGSTQQYVMNAFGDYYTLTVNSTKSWGTWTFNVYCTFPNGTSYEDTVTKFAPLASTYDMTLQAYWWDGGYWTWEAQVYVTILPLDISTFKQGINGTQDDPDLYSYVFDYYDPVAFYEIYGSSTEVIPVVYVSLVTQEEFEKHVGGSIIPALGDLGGRVGAAAWTAALQLAEMIPGVGPYLVVGLELMAVIIKEAFWWLNFLLIENIWYLFCILEIWALGDAMTRARGTAKIVERAVKNHIKFFNWFIDLATKLVGLIARVVEAIGSLIPFT